MVNVVLDAPVLVKVFGALALIRLRRLHSCSAASAPGTSRNPGAGR
jgi:hypothetical protein